MKFWQISISRRSLTIAAALVVTVSLGIGAHAALNKRALDAARAIASEQGEAAAQEWDKKKKCRQGARPSEYQ